MRLSGRSTPTTSRQDEFDAASDAEALEAFQLLSRTEGIIPALETAHGLAGAFRRAASLDPEKILIVNLSGRGDKDVAEAQRVLGMTESVGG